MRIKFKNDLKQLFVQLRFFFILLLLAIFLVSLTRDLRMMGSILILFLLLEVPQIYLALQYEKASSYNSITIDFGGQLIKIVDGRNQIIEKELYNYLVDKDRKYAYIKIKS